MVVAEDRPIVNEVLFRKFRTIVTSDASAGDLQRAAQSREELEAVYEIVLSNKKGQKFVSDLEKIKKLIGGLRVRDFRGSQREIELLTEVARLTTDRLPRFLKHLD